MVGAVVLGHGTLAVHQEAVPATLLGQGCLVSLSDEGVQLGLLTADGLHKLMGNTQWHMEHNLLTGTLWLDVISTDLYKKKITAYWRLYQKICALNILFHRPNYCRYRFYR